MASHDNHKVINSASEVGNQLILVAAVVWELPGDNHESNSVTSKLKVYSQDLVSAPGSAKDRQGAVSAQDLTRLLKKELETNIWKRTIDADESSSFQIDIYDPHQSTYVSVANASTIRDIVQRFGSRLRISVRLSLATNTLDSQSSEESLHKMAIMGRFYPYDALEGILIAGSRLRVKEVANQHNAGTGVNVWDGALLLAQYLEKQPALVRHKRVLELGAGCGLVGLAAGVLGAQQVLLTDLAYAIPNMQANIDLHEALWKEGGCESIQCTTCDWFDPPSLSNLTSNIIVPQQNDDDCQKQFWVPDVILIADCVWMRELVQPLLKTIQHFVASILGPKYVQVDKCIQLLISYQRRGKDTHDEFWSGIHSLPGGTVTELNVDSVGLSKPDVIYLLSLQFKGTGE